MTDLVHNIPPPFNMIVVITLMVATWGVIVSVAKEVRKCVCQRQEIELKRDLIKRGLSVDEVERVVSASGTATRRSKHAHIRGVAT